MRRARAILSLAVLLCGCHVVLPLAGTRRTDDASPNGDMGPARDVAPIDEIVPADVALEAPPPWQDGPLDDSAPVDASAGCGSFSTWGCATSGLTSCMASCGGDAGLAKLDCLHNQPKSMVICTCSASWTPDWGQMTIPDTDYAGCGFCDVAFLSACPPSMFP